MVRRIIPLVEDVVSRSAFGFFRFRSVCFSLCSLVPLCVACLLPLPKKEYFLSVEDTLSSIFSVLFALIRYFLNTGSPSRQCLWCRKTLKSPHSTEIILTSDPGRVEF